MQKIAIGTQGDSAALLRDIDQHGTLKYLAGPISFSDLENNASTEQWNEYLCDNLVENGYLLMDMDYEIKAIDGEVFIQVTADTSEWASSMQDDEQEEDDHDPDGNGGFY